MVLKKPSQAAGKRDVSPEAADKLARQLADKPYGEKAPEPQGSQKAKPISISLPPSVIEQLEDAVRKNKRSGEGLRTISAIIKEALDIAGYK